MPDVKLIALLRNPVDRTYSHYQHKVRVGKETLSFQEALEQEPIRLQAALERLGEVDFYASAIYRISNRRQITQFSAEAFAFAHLHLNRMPAVSGSTLFRLGRGVLYFCIIHSF